MSFQKEVIEIRPSNAGSGRFSFKKGTPLIEFQIPQAPKFLLGKSLRINGRLTIAQNVAADGTPTFADNSDDATKVQIDSRTGVASCIDMVTIGNNFGQNYETVKNYNRLVASLLPLNQSFNEYISGGSDVSYAATGKNKQQGFVTERSIDFSMPILAGILQGQPLDLQMSLGCKRILL